MTTPDPHALEQAQHDEDLRWLLAARPQIVRRILAQSGVFRLSYTSEKPLDSAFNEGARNLGLWLLDACRKAAPQHWQRLLHEDGQASDGYPAGDGYDR